MSYDAKSPGGMCTIANAHDSAWSNNLGDVAAVGKERRLHKIPEFREILRCSSNGAR